MLTDERIVELFDVNDMDDSYQISKKRIVAFARAVEAEVREECAATIERMVSWQYGDCASDYTAAIREGRGYRMNPAGGEGKR